MIIQPFVVSKISVQFESNFVVQTGLKSVMCQLNLLRRRRRNDFTPFVIDDRNLISFLLSNDLNLGSVASRFNASHSD